MGRCRHQSIYNLPFCIFRRTFIKCPKRFCSELCLLFLNNYRWITLTLTRTNKKKNRGTNEWITESIPINNGKYQNLSLRLSQVLTNSRHCARPSPTYLGLVWDTWLHHWCFLLGPRNTADQHLLPCCKLHPHESKKHLGQMDNTNKENQKEVKRTLTITTITSRIITAELVPFVLHNL